MQTKPVPGYGSAQEPEVGRGSKKLHWEEKVFRPVIFGNNYDPLQEVIINEEGWGEGLSVGGNCVCRGSCGSVHLLLLPHTHHGVLDYVFCSTWHSGLSGTQLSQFL